MSSAASANWTLDPDVIHLNHGSFGAAPRVVLGAQQRWRNLLEANPDTFMFEQYQPALDKARIRLADFIGADPEGLGFVNNATSGINAVLRSLESGLEPGDEIVITNHTYNACRNAAVVSARRAGAHVVVASFPFPISGPEEVTEAVLGAVTNRTKIVIIDAVTSPTGLIVPASDIVAALEPDVEVLIDAAHAPGMIDFDIAEIGASYVTANCHKWMCAPKGAAFLHVREDRRDGIYSSVISHGYNGGWPSEGGHIHQQFDWIGTDDPSAWLCVPDAIDAVASLQPDGWAGVRRTNRRLCLAGRDILIDMLGIEAPAPDDMIGSIASIPLPDAPDHVERVLDPMMVTLRHKWSIEVPVFVWPQAPQRLVRISAQQYNSIDEYEHLGEALVSELGL